jgi:hypothetical protein
VVVNSIRKICNIVAYTSGCALIIACRLVRWGSSVYVQKKSCWGDFVVSLSFVEVMVVVEDIVKL